jgi:hypothetical protein
VRRLGKRINLNEIPRVSQRGFGLITQTLDEHRQDPSAQTTQRFTFRDPPLVVAIAGWQIGAVEKLAGSFFASPSSKRRASGRRFVEM